MIITPYFIEGSRLMTLAPEPEAYGTSDVAEVKLYPSVGAPLCYTFTKIVLVCLYAIRDSCSRKRGVKCLRLSKGGYLISSRI